MRGGRRFYGKDHAQKKEHGGAAVALRRNREQSHGAGRRGLRKSKARFGEH